MSRRRQIVVRVFQTLITWPFMLVENWSKWRHLLKNTTRVENIITVRVENCSDIRDKVFVALYANWSKFVWNAVVTYRQSVIKSVGQVLEKCIYSKQDICYVWTLDNKGISTLNSVHEILLNTRNTAEVLIQFLLEWQNFLLTAFRWLHTGKEHGWELCSSQTNERNSAGKYCWLDAEMDSW